MRLLAIAVALGLSACVPALQTPPPGTPAKTVEQCAADASMHRILTAAGIGAGVAGLGLIIAGVAVNNGHNAMETYALATPGAALAGGGLAFEVGADGVTLKFAHDGCVPVVGPMPVMTKAPQ